jgi:hypothetical protein
MRSETSCMSGWRNASKAHGRRRQPTTPRCYEFADDRHVTGSVRLLLRVQPMDLERGAPVYDFHQISGGRSGLLSLRVQINSQDGSLQFLNSAANNLDNDI